DAPLACVWGSAVASCGLAPRRPRPVHPDPAAGAGYLVPDFFTRVGRFPTALRATSLTARPAFLAASDRFPAGLFREVVFLPTTFLAASPTAFAVFFPASDSSPDGL